MAIMSVKDALDAVLQDIEAMDDEQLHALHEAHRNGDIAVAMRELHSYVGAHFEFHQYPVENIEAISIPDGEAVVLTSVFPMGAWNCDNDGTFALAA
jgi:hypothetical protein